MHYEEYFKAASEGLIVVDRRGRILEANLLVNNALLLIGEQMRKVDINPTKS